MTVPTLRISDVFHVGDMEASAKRERSYEGQMLSVSLCPSAWEQIARLGGSEYRKLTLDGAEYLDILAMSDAEKAQVVEWASKAGFVRSKILWRLYSLDEDDEERYFEFPTEAAALSEFDEEFDEEFDDGPPDVRKAAGVILTKAGRKRAGGRLDGGDNTDMALAFWAEDVLRIENPNVVGVWWDETFEPESLSAPRGGIFPSLVRAFSVQIVAPENMPDDENERRTGFAP